MRQIYSLVCRVAHRIDRELTEAVEYSIPHLKLLGLIGFTGFPLYYWIWGYLFPQPYENLFLRLLGSILFLGFMLVDYWSDRYRKYFKAYWLFAVSYALPFFFTFMLLKNESNMVWAMSMMAAIILLILVAYHWVLATVIFLVGSMIAFLSFFLLSIFLTSSLPITNLENYWIQVPIYLFVVMAGSAFNYRSSIMREEKLKVLASAGAEIAHELRTPLTTIEYHARNIQHAALSAPSNDNMNLLDRSRSIQLEINHTNTVIDMLLMDLGRKKVSETRFSYYKISDVIESSILRYPFHSDLEREKVDFDRDNDFSISGSSILIAHVFFNLIKNALIHSKENSKIYISLSRKNKYNEVIVKDTGKGIPESSLPYIFDDFYTSSDSGRGTGIGLSFCKKVMHQLNGKITCESKLGEYTVFKLLFPYVDDIEAENNYLYEPFLNIGNPSVLFVDDDLHLYEKLIDSFIRSGYTVDTCRDGRDALQKVKNNRYGIVIIDLNMPIMSGYETISAIRSGDEFSEKDKLYYKNIPILAFSSEPKEVAAPKASQCGASDFIEKQSYQPVDVLYTIHKYSNKLHINQKLSGVKILVIDDHEVNHKIIADVLSPYKAIIKSALTAKEAFDNLKQNSFDCILIDIHMPEVTGIEIVETIRSNKIPNTENISIVALSGDIRESIAKKSFDAGVDAFLHKPINEKELVKILVEQIHTGEKQLAASKDPNDGAKESHFFRLAAKLVHDMATPTAILEMNAKGFISFYDEVFRVLETDESHGGSLLDSYHKVVECLSSQVLVSKREVKEFWNKIKEDKDIKSQEEKLVYTITELKYIWSDIYISAEELSDSLNHFSLPKSKEHNFNKKLMNVKNNIELCSGEIDRLRKKLLSYEESLEKEELVNAIIS